MIKIQNLSSVFFSLYDSRYLLILFSFFLPISNSISSILIGLLFLCFFFSKNKVKKIKLLLKNKIPVSIILFFLFIVISGIWFKKNIDFLDLNSSFIYELNKNWTLLLCPLLFLFNFDEKTKKYAQNGFIAGLILNVLLSILIYINEKFIFLAKRGHYVNEYYLHGFLDHSDLSIFFCFGVFLIIERILKKEGAWAYLLLLLICLLFFLFNSYGRTGILCFLILLPLFLIFNKKYKFHVFLITLIFSFLIILVSISFSNSLSSRFSSTITEISDLVYGVSLEKKIDREATHMANQDTLQRPKKHWKKRIMLEKNQIGEKTWLNDIRNKENKYKTSVGKRVLLWKNYIKISKKNKILGQGLGSVSYLKKEENMIIERPHNNYLFVMTEFGIIGLLIFINIFIVLIKDYFTTKNNNILKILFPMIFLLSMCINDYFFIYNTLAFFGLFSYLLYSPKAN